MKHYGDITQVCGYNVPPVDIITGGSPCQDLSIAGKRAGLAGNRSGLFMEQIRIIKEMRENDRTNGRSDVNIRPRYMVWENVPGAFSSNKGEDFRAVLEETAKVAKRDACIPRFEGGRWPHAGCIMGDGWSIAWRVHDAQFWGVPQRRKRIALVADFGGQTAPEILFERESVSGDIEACGKEGKDVAIDVRSSIEETSRIIEDWVSAVNNNAKHQQDLIQSDLGVARTLAPGTHASGSHLTKTLVTGIKETSGAISFQERAGKPGGGKGILIQNERTGALSTLNNQSVCCLNDQGGSQMNVSDNVSGTLRAQEHGHQPMVMEPFNSSKNSYHTRFTNDGKAETLVATDYKDPQTVTCINSVVRRLTPLECERLQGFPDGWTDIGDWVDSKGKLHKGDADSPRYKALGNSIALPFWEWMAKRIVKHIDGEPTMASLFDGIGGFPLVFSRCGCNPIWNSEIEEFPEAVVRAHFD